MKKKLELVFIIIAIAFITACASAPPQDNPRFDNYVSVAGLDSGALLTNLYAYGDWSAENLSYRISHGRDTIDNAADSFIIKYIQEETGRVFLIPVSQLENVADKESYIAVILQYSTYMSASPVDYPTAFLMMFDMAKKIKKEKNIVFPEWIEKGISMNSKELEAYRKSSFNEDKYVFSLK